MCHPKIFVLMLFLVGSGYFSKAQHTPVKTDSSKMYRDIEHFSKKRKSTNFIYGIFFKPVDSLATSKINIKKRRSLRRPYSTYERKVIREIYITTLDPFGNSITDSTIVAQNFLYKAGNKLHVKSRRSTIRNLLLFNENDLFDSLLVKESERLIRTQKFVHEVTLIPVPAGNKSDSVDIFIRELDIWSIIPEGDISPSGMMAGITDENFFGMGHQFQNAFTRNFTSGVDAFNTNYYIPNIRNTYINSTLHYGVDGYRNFNRSVAIDRPFYSPFAKWAAGAFASSQFKHDSVSINSEYFPLPLKFSTQDYWAGTARQLADGNTEDARTTNIILATRYLRIRYIERPSEFVDPFHVYAGEDFYIAGIGISTRKYIQDKYVFNYGITEDVPVGRVYGITGGYQVKNNSGRLYLGARFATGNYNDWGYLSSNFEYGTFYRSSRTEQSVFSAGLIYFTDLFEIGNWKFRQFIKPQATIGINRFPTEKININNENGIRGFDSYSSQGTGKLVLTLQTQSYAPWSILGFRFGPYAICSLAMLGNETSGFRKSKVFSQFSLGVLIKNDFLVFNIFQISIGFYPVIPDVGNNILKINSNSTTDFGLRDFTLGKPASVVYQ